MEHLNLPRGKADLAPQVFLLEARTGGRRRCLLDQWVRETGSSNAYLLDCCFAEHGVWAGVKDLLEPVLSRASKNLLDRHSYELSHIFSDLHNRAAAPRRSLTDLSLSAERTRNYATDRAHRIIQGLVDFLAGCMSSEDERSPLVLACDSFDEASSLCRCFILELLRRRGVELSLTLLLAVQDGAGTDFARSLPRDPALRTRVDLPADPESEKLDPALVEREALELESRIVAEPVDLLTELPRITKLWRQAQRHDKVLKWSALALGTYNHYGFYEDARRFCETVSNNIEELSRDPDFFPFWKMTRWNLLGNLFGCLVQLNEPVQALEVVQREGLSKIEDLLDRGRVCYVLAMLDARYLPQKNFARAELYLQEGLGILKSLPASTEVHFFTTFLENGLALVAHRQGRTEEAVELCSRGLQRLEAHLPLKSHRLHRSVLLYNIAQVYDSTGHYEKAIEYYSAAMEMDPNYPEYYNERGSALLKLGRTKEAICDYLSAIELSPPYCEVWTNLGQAYRRIGDLRGAAEAYSRAIDLDPEKLLPHLGRAQCREALEEWDAALADYNEALRIEPNQPYTLSNRAVLWYERGEISRALEDLDRAIMIAPEVEEFRQNRSIALAVLKQPDRSGVVSEQSSRPPSNSDCEPLSALLGIEEGRIQN